MLWFWGFLVLFFDRMAKFGFGVLEPIAFIYTVCCVREGGGEGSTWSTEVVTVTMLM